MSCCSTHGRPESDFFAANIGTQNLCANNVTTCNIVVPTVAGVAGGIGPNGIEGLVGPNGLSIIGPAGPIGAIGPQGIEGPVGPDGLGGIIAAGMFAQLGAQPAPLAASVAVTYTTTVISSPVITLVPAGGLGGGSAFELATIGDYEINFQLEYTTDGGFQVFASPTLAGLQIAGSAALPYSMVGQTATGGGGVMGSIILTTTTANSFVSINAAPGNAAAVAIPASSSTGNQNSSTLSIKLINV